MDFNYRDFMAKLEIPLQSDLLRPFANWPPRPLENDPLVLKTKTQIECRLERFFIPTACISVFDEKKDKGGQLGADWGGQFSADSPKTAKTKFKAN